MSWRGRSTYRRRPRRYVDPPEVIGPMLPEQFSDEEVEPPKPEEGEPATQSQDPAPAQEGEDEGASAGQVMEREEECPLGQSLKLRARKRFARRPIMSVKMVLMSRR
uniref:G antigen 10 isoform X1 n=1 Tax=Macaca mulatta TaxID=9544 RepID=UPI0010A25F91|nr:G antigen 10 isoform X1 [Macaca mulatta]XP_028698051.1 G antigen 10 isoform X1 [Macaca mulatta]